MLHSSLILASPMLETSFIPGEQVGGFTGILMAEEDNMKLKNILSDCFISGLPFVHSQINYSGQSFARKSVLSER